MLDAPVVLIAFNRPDIVRRTFSRVREAAPSRLFLIVDGPRPSRPDDVTKCEAVRRELEVVDWACEVERKYADSNLGCVANIELGLDWVFRHTDRAIVLEDDCLPDPSFFTFCDELLARFEGDERVWQISGHNGWLPAHRFEGKSYAFSALAGIWGWATWRRAWQKHRASLTRDHRADGLASSATPMRSHSVEIEKGVFQTASAYRAFSDVAREPDPTGDTFGWDSQWVVSMALHRALGVFPAVNLVENIGLGPDASHTHSKGLMPPAQSMEFPLRHPSEVRANVFVQREAERVAMRYWGRFAHRARRIVGDGPLRPLARRIGSWSWPWRLMRVLARGSDHLRRPRRC